MMEADPAAAPQIVGGIDIFGDEGNLCVPPDQLVVVCATLRGNQCQNRTSVRWRNCHPPAELEAPIRHNAEPKLIDIEAPAALVVPHEDVGLDDPYVRTRCV